VRSFAADPTAVFLRSRYLHGVRSTTASLRYRPVDGIGNRINLHQAVRPFLDTYHGSTLMGEHNVNREADPAVLRAFTHHLLQDV